MLFRSDALGNVTTSSLAGTVPLTVPNTIGVPNATTLVDLNVNFPAAISPALNVNTPFPGAPVYGPAPVGTLDRELELNPANPNPATYHNSTSATVFDTQGSTHILTMYFVMTNDLTNRWEVRSTLDGVPMTVGGAGIFGPAVLDFDANGMLDIATSTNGGNIPYDAFALTNGAAPLTLAVDFTNQGNTLTQESQGSFTVQSLTQDGYATGRLSGLEVDDEGLVRASFTNGQNTPLGKIAMARFDNSQGLRQIGNTSWLESVESGVAIAGEAGTGSFGLLQSGALETSNVDLTAELVNLITSQRNFQANSKAIETANAITQTIINLR